MKKRLTAATVERAGKTARSWNDETTKVELNAENDSFRLEFSLSSKGGGITDVRLTIGPDDFSALVSAMVIADRGRAMREIAATLASEIAGQSDYDKVITREARKSVAEAAQLAYTQAPDGRNHAERLTRDMVGQLVDQLNESDEAESAAE